MGEIDTLFENMTDVNAGDEIGAAGQAAVEEDAGADTQAANTDGALAPTPAPEPDPGQEAASPPADTGAEDKGTPDPKVEVEVKDKGTPKPPPFDQDPKWKAARAAEKSLQGILEKHNLGSVDDLSSRLQQGQEISEILGNKDAAKLVEDSAYLGKVKNYWADQETQKLEEGETPDQTIARLKGDNANLREDFASKNAKRDETDASLGAIETFNSTVNTSIEGLEGMTPAEKAMLGIYLGVENPSNEIDIADTTAVKKITAEGTVKFQKFVAEVKQSAIDEYSQGKSKILPLSKTSTAPASKAVEKTPISKDATVQETFDAAKAEFLEVLEQEAANQQ